MLRGRYARICVEVLLGVLVKKYITIGIHKQCIVYEGENILCVNSGVLGLTSFPCTRDKENKNEREGTKVPMAESNTGNESLI